MRVSEGAHPALPTSPRLVSQTSVLNWFSLDFASIEIEAHRLINDMDSILEYFSVSSGEKLPQMDVAYLANRGYDSVNELMRAIILRTIEDLNNVGELRDEAVAYLFDDEEEYIFSFKAICRHLGFDPDKTRFMIINAKHRISTRRRAA